VTAALLPHPPPHLVQVQVQELLEALVQHHQPVDENRVSKAGLID
jgi:hypothetical protein